MDLIKSLLINGDSSEVLLHWPCNPLSQAQLKSQMEDYLQDIPKNKSLIIDQISHPLYSLNLTPTLLNQSLSSNHLDILEQILKFKGSQLDGKMLGKVFTHLQSCQIPAGFNPPRPNYKPVKIEGLRQGIQLKRSDRIRYYLLLLCVSGTKTIPQIKAFDGNCGFFVFVFKYLMTFVNTLPFAPTPDRFLDFFNGVLNGAGPSGQFLELSGLVNEYIAFTESTSFVFYVLTAQKETFPAKALESFSKVELN